MEDYPVHVLQPGESLELISARYGVPICMIVRLNSKALKRGAVRGLALKIPPVNFCASFSFREHTVKEGETVFSISREFSVAMSELMRKNGISRPGALKPGMRISIPPSRWLYTVKATDTLQSIAEATGVSTEELIRLNGSKSVYRGMQLRLE